MNDAEEDAEPDMRPGVMESPPITQFSSSIRLFPIVVHGESSTVSNSGITRRQCLDVDTKSL
jgi:hypothetical protein